MENKQTPVEWLESNIIHMPYTQKDFAHNVKMFQQAKLMAKEQISGAYNDGALMSYTLTFKEPFVKGEEYYNENYGK
jgi:hypothetical protein